MSIAVAYQQVVMPDLRIWYGYVESYGPSSIVITDGVNRAVYTGAFTYDASGSVFGQLSSYSKYLYGSIEYTVSGMTVNAFDAFILIQSGNAVAVANLVFAGNDSLSGSGFNDVLRSFSGNDTVSGNNGNDSLFGESGNDFVYGGAGNDWLYGDAGNDSLFGGIGNDVLNGGAASDQMTGGTGNDTYVVDNLSDIIVEATGGGTADRVISVGSFALAADDNIELLQTSNATGITALNLRGNWVAQTLIGNAGANRLDGLGGSDTIVGGAGGDVFVFSAALGLANIDRLTDYSVAADRIEIDNVAFIGLVNGALAASAFTANLTGVATDTLDRIIYETNTGFLWFDRDGSGAAFGRVQFADLAGSLAMTAGEFMVI